MTNKIEQLKKAIIKANPSILELKFGCEVKHKKYKGVKFIIAGRRYTDDCALIDYDGKTIIEATEADEQPDEPYDFKDLKIIGRDITLFDVYDTVEKIAYREVKGIKFRHTKFGEVKTFKDDEIKILHMWKRHKPLQDQPKETIELLYNLICKK